MSQNKFKSLGVFIFGGSQTIGHLQSGWTVDKILEMTDDMTDYNAHHFAKNYSNIKVIKPSQWQDNIYKAALRENKYDLFFANNPCSGLSRINKNPGTHQPINSKFYEVFDLINWIEPKTFLIENAPGLSTIGTAILHDMVNILDEKYLFTIIRDEAGNHNVPMKRPRTLLIGWNKKIFKGIPLLQMNKQPMTKVGDVLQGLSNDSNNMEYDEKHHHRVYTDLIPYYDKVDTDMSILMSIVRDFDFWKDKISPTLLKRVQTIQNKLADNKGYWDKSPSRVNPNKRCGSITSITQYIHPTEHRDFYIREYARLMGYPDDFIFYPEECQCSSVQCIAQGVPVNFIKYISAEIKEALEGHRDILNDCDLIFQQHIREKYNKLTKNQFLLIDSLNENKEKAYDLVV